MFSQNIRLLKRALDSLCTSITIGRVGYREDGLLGMSALKQKEIRDFFLPYTHLIYVLIIRYLSYECIISIILL